MVNRLVESDSTVDIVKKTQGGSKALKGLSSLVSDDKTIEFNPDGQRTAILKGVGGNVTGKTPSYIELGHELIHADHDIRDNVFKELYQNSELTKVSAPVQAILGQRPNGDFATLDEPDFKSKINELRTIGIGGYNQEDDITENDLRREAGLTERASHASPE